MIGEKGVRRLFLLRARGMTFGRALRTTSFTSKTQITSIPFFFTDFFVTYTTNHFFFFIAHLFASIDSRPVYPVYKDKTL
jgi:hypothetical protein